MGFFDWVMRGLGFDDKNKKEKKSNTAVNGDDKYSNFNLHERVEGETVAMSSLPTSANFNSFGLQPESNIIMVEPTTHKEIQQVIDYLKQGQSIAVNLEGIADEDRMRILDFLSGAIYGLNGSILRWHGDLFLLTPEGHKILRPENSDKK